MDTTSGNLQRAQERLIRGAHLKHSSHPRPQYRGGSIELGPVPFAAGEAGKEPLARNCLTLSRDPIWPLVLGDGDQVEGRRVGYGMFVRSLGKSLELNSLGLGPR